MADITRRQIITVRNDFIHMWWTLGNQCVSSFCWIKTSLLFRDMWDTTLQSRKKTPHNIGSTQLLQHKLRDFFTLVLTIIITTNPIALQCINIPYFIPHQKQSTITCNSCFINMYALLYLCIQAYSHGQGNREKLKDSVHIRKTMSISASATDKRNILDQ